MKTRHIIHIALLAVSLLLPTVARAGSNSAVNKLKEEVRTLSTSVKDLQQSFIQQGTAFNQKMATIEQMQAEWSGFHGEVDATSQQLQILLDQFQKFVDEFDARLKTVETQMAQSSKSNTSDIAGTATVNNDHLELYQSALTAVRERRYREAVGLFRRFLQHEPESGMADRAQYWVGECYFASGDYHQAVIEYEMLATKFPKSNHLNEALLHKGNALVELGMIQKAQTTLEQIVARAPQSKEARSAQSQLHTMRSASRTAERTDRQ